MDDYEHDEEMGEESEEMDESDEIDDIDDDDDNDGRSDISSDENTEHLMRTNGLKKINQQLGIGFLWTNQNSLMPKSRFI